MIGLGLFEMLIISVVGILLLGVPLVVVGIVISLNSNKPKQN